MLDIYRALDRMVAAMEVAGDTVNVAFTLAARHGRESLRCPFPDPLAEEVLSRGIWRDFSSTSAGASGAARSEASRYEETCHRLECQLRACRNPRKGEAVVHALEPAETRDRVR